MAVTEIDLVIVKLGSMEYKVKWQRNEPKSTVRHEDGHSSDYRRNLYAL